LYGAAAACVATMRRVNSPARRRRRPNRPHRKRNENVIRALVALSFVVSAVGPLAAAPATEDAFAAPIEAPSLGLDFCAPPVRPVCLDDARAFDDPQGRKSCEDQTNRYVATVFAYRDCMYAQIEKAIRRTNESIALMKCREENQASCP